MKTYKIEEIKISEGFLNGEIYTQLAPNNQKAYYQWKIDLHLDIIRIENFAYRCSKLILGPFTLPFMYEGVTSTYKYFNNWFNIQNQEFISAVSATDGIGSIYYQNELPTVFRTETDIDNDWWCDNTVTIKSIKFESIKKNKIDFNATISINFDDYCVHPPPFIDTNLSIPVFSISASLNFGKVTFENLNPETQGFALQLASQCIDLNYYKLKSGSFSGSNDKNEADFYYLDFII